MHKDAQSAASIQGQNVNWRLDCLWLVQLTVSAPLQFNHLWNVLGIENPKGKSKDVEGGKSKKSEYTSMEIEIIIWKKTLKYIQNSQR